MQCYFILLPGGFIFGVLSRVPHLIIYKKKWLRISNRNENAEFVVYALIKLFEIFNLVSVMK